MPYTPPSQQSPGSSKTHSPAISRTSSYSSEDGKPAQIGRPTPPRSLSSTSYLHKHRRSPSIKSDNGAPPTPTEGAESGIAAQDFAHNGSVVESPIPVNHHLMAHGAMLSPPDSSENSDGDDHTHRMRGRELAHRWNELQEAVRGISQKRESSPEKPGVAHTGTASEPTSTTSSPTALSAEARKISHSRSTTELYMKPRTSFAVSPVGTSCSDDSDEEETLIMRPSLIRKKSGELVKPALRPSSRRRYSSMPGTPTYSKTVHFNDSDNQTRHFLQVDKPIAVSAGTSPVETVYDSESEYPFDSEAKIEREIKLSNFPADTITRRAKPVRVERIFLSTDKNTLIGVCAVQNIAFHKTVAVRFTLDYWKTTSEVLADFNNDPSNRPVDGCDRFNFYVKLSDLKNIEDKTLLLCVRYNVSGQEFWDNNENANYQVDFVKVSKKSSKPQAPSGLGARPLNAIPRSRHSPTSTSRGRHDGLDDDFARRASTYSLVSADNLLGETSSSIKLKPRGHRGSLFPTAKDASSSNGLGGRYDFSASLSAALTQAQEKLSKHDSAGVKSGNPSYFGPIERVDGPTKVAKAEERPDAIITTDRPAMGSDQYKDLVQKFCYASSPPQTQSESTPKSAGSITQQPRSSIHASVDGTFDRVDESASPSVIDSGTSSPMIMNRDEREQKRPASAMRSPFESRSASPAPITGVALSDRAASPLSFGYPYRHTSRDGYLSDASSAPTAIQG